MSLFNVRAMPNRCCDRLDQKQPGSEGLSLGLTETRTADPLPMIPHQVETQFIASQPFQASVSGLIPSLSATPVTCWYRKCQYQAMVTQTVWEYPHQLGCQTLHYKTLPWFTYVHTEQFIISCMGCKISFCCCSSRLICSK